MRLADYPDRDGKRVWLAQTEIEDLIAQTKSREQKLAVLLGARAGLRRSEIVSVTPNDFVHAPDGFLRVWEGYAKREKYRETPIPERVTNSVEDVMYNQPPDDPVVGVQGNTVYRWVKRGAERLYAATGDKGWTFLDVHDLRRTWATDLLEQGVLPSVVMSWGGWDDWDTFREHYLGEFSPEALERERGKVDYLGGSAARERQGVEQHQVPISKDRPWRNG